MDIAIIDYGIGNLRSAEKALQHLGFNAALTQDPDSLKEAKKIVLPGVGNFGECIDNFRACGFEAPLLAEINAGKPLLGICVGLQMLFERSEESPHTRGLGLLKGSVKKFGGEAFRNHTLKIPQIGWNALRFPEKRHPLFADINPGDHVYFVHSFYAEPADTGDVLAWADYGAPFCAAAGRGNVAGVQFHPEKSQRIGLAILRSFGKL